MRRNRKIGGPLNTLLFLGVVVALFAMYPVCARAGAIYHFDDLHTQHDAVGDPVDASHTQHDAVGDPADASDQPALHPSDSPHHVVALEPTSALLLVSSVLPVLALRALRRHRSNLRGDPTAGLST